MAKRMKKLRSCIVVSVILMCVMSGTVLAVDSGDNAAKASNRLDGLEEKFTENNSSEGGIPLFTNNTIGESRAATNARDGNTSGDGVGILDANLPMVYLNDTQDSVASRDSSNDIILTDIPNDTHENVSVTSCTVSVAIDDDTCVGYEVYIDGVYQFTEGQGTTPDGFCSFSVTEGTHTLEIRKNGCSASKTHNFLCGVSYTWVSMPDYWCEGGGGDCDNPPTVNFDKSSYYEGDTVQITVSTSLSSVYYEITDCSGTVRETGYTSGGTISYTIPDGSTSSCCYWTICFYWDEGGDPVGPVGAAGNINVESYQCTKCYNFYVCPDTCGAYVEIEDKVCFGYEVYVDGVHKLTEGQGTTPDGYCSFTVSEGDHTIEIRKDGCSEIVYSHQYFQCNGQYKKILQNYWCDCDTPTPPPCDNPPTVQFDKPTYCEGDTIHATVSAPHMKNRLITYEIKDCSGTVRKTENTIDGSKIEYLIPKGMSSSCCKWSICFSWKVLLEEELYQCGPECYDFEVCPDLKPDLIVEEITWSPSNPDIEQSVTFTVKIKNNGDDNAESSHAKLLIDGTEITTVSVGALSAGSSTTKTFTWTASGCGDHTVEAIADCNNVVSESNEWNNEQTETVKVDCVYEVKFRGEVLVNRPIISFYSIDIKIDEILNDPTGKLKVGDVVTAWSHRDSPAKIEDPAVGDIAEVFGKYFGRDVRAGVESDYIDLETASHYLKIEKKPDLIIQSISCDKGSPKQGDTITFTITVKNQGSGSAGTSYVYYYIDGSYVDYDYVPALSAGSGSPQTFTWTANKCGNVQVKAVADVTNAVAESNEGNNQRVETINIGCPKIPAFESKGIYVWGFSTEFFKNENERERFFNLIKNDGIKTAFLSIDESLLADPACKEFVKDAKNGNPQVHAMIGANWSAGDADKIDPFVREVLKYNAENPNCMFSGIHLDAEPGDYPLKDFLGDYKEKLIDMKSRLNYNGETISSQKMALSIDVGCWWANEPNDLKDLIGVLDLDYITIMAYRDDATDITELANKVTSIAQEKGKPFVISLETQEFKGILEDGNFKPEQPEYVTFFEEGQCELQQELEKLEENYKDDELFKGFAIHYYQSSFTPWHIITDVIWPSGEFNIGDSVNVSVKLRTSDNFNERPVGIGLSVRDEKGNVYPDDFLGLGLDKDTSKIILMGGKDEKEVELMWGVPEVAEEGWYDITVAAWDIDLNEDELHESTLLKNYPEVTEIGMYKLYKMNILGLRKPFVELDREPLKESWKEDQFKITTEAEYNPKVSIPACAPSLEIGYVSTTFQFVVNVTNEGTAEDIIDLSVSDTKDWSVELSKYFVTLSPGEYEYVYVNIIGKKIGTETITVKATSKNDNLKYSKLDLKIMNSKFEGPLYIALSRPYPLIPYNQTNTIVSAPDYIKNEIDEPAVVIFFGLNKTTENVREAPIKITNVETGESIDLKIKLADFDDVKATNFHTWRDGYSFSNWKGCHFITKYWKKACCYGMSETSILYFDGRLELPDNISSTNNLTREQAEGRIKAHQASASLLSPWDSRWSKQGEEYEKIVSNITKGNPIMLSLANSSSLWTEERHTVAAYKIVNDGDTSFIYVYDPNWPYGDLTNVTISLIRFNLTTNESKYGDYNVFIAEEAKTLPDETTLSIECPLNTTITDQYGRIITDDGTNEIPNASMLIINETKIFYLPADLTYLTEIDAYDTGTFNFTRVSPIGNDISITKFENIPVTSSTKASVDIEPGVTDYTMSIDYNGDGTTDEEKSPDVNETIIASPNENIFDTRASANTYPSISGTHTGTIAPTQDITVQKLYTYPCAGTGGHTESVRIYGNEIDESASWNGYAEDGDTLTFDSSFTLEAGKTYNYVIITGSYPQIHHTDNLSTPAGFITCSEFRDVNGKRYSDWIPAIRLT